MKYLTYAAIAAIVISVIPISLATPIENNDVVICLPTPSPEVMPIIYWIICDLTDGASCGTITNLLNLMQDKDYIVCIATSLITP